MMTNEQFIRSLPLRDLASLVLRRRYEEDWDYTYGEDGEDVPFFWGYRTYLVTSDGLEYDEDDYKDAIEHECWWLQQEATAFVKMEGINNGYSISRDG